jgi:hypothetical protein
MLRTTSYSYSDDPNYINANMLRLVSRVTVTDSTGVILAKSVFDLDNYASKGGMESYGLSPSSPDYPPNHNSNFDQNWIYRGNVTGTTSWGNHKQVQKLRHIWQCGSGRCLLLSSQEFSFQLRKAVEAIHKTAERGGLKPIHTTKEGRESSCRQLSAQLCGSGL